MDFSTLRFLGVGFWPAHQGLNKLIFRFRPCILGGSWDLRLMDKILHDLKDPKLWELWYIPYYGSCRILSINRSKYGYKYLNWVTSNFKHSYLNDNPIVTKSHDPPSILRPPGSWWRQ